MRIRSSEKWFAKFRGYPRRPSVEIKPTFIKMAPLDGVEAIDFIDQTRTDRGAQNIKWVGSEGKKRGAARGSQPPQIVEIADATDLIARHVQDHHIRAFQFEFGGGDQEDAHLRGIGKNFRAIKNGVVQRNCQDSKAKHTCTLEQLMRRIVESVFGIIESMNVQIELDPFVRVLRPRRQHRFNLLTAVHEATCEAGVSPLLLLVLVLVIESETSTSKSTRRSLLRRRPLS